MLHKSSVDEPVARKRKICEDDLDSEQSEGPIAIKRETKYFQVFQQFRLMSSLTEPGTTTTCLTVAIFLPSGVGARNFLCVFWTLGMSFK